MGYLKIKLNGFLGTDGTEIIKEVDAIGSAILTPTSHSYKTFGPIRIKEAAFRHAKAYTDQAKACPPLSVIDVVLAANREYNVMVEPVISNLKLQMLNGSDIPFLQAKTIRSLLEYLKKHLRNFYNTYVINDINGVSARKSINDKEREFITKTLGFKEVNHGKIKTLFDILIAINASKGKKQITDYEFLKDWANNEAEFIRKDGSIIKARLAKALGRKIHNVGVATIQHLRMHFGADTFKPDQRVKEVLLFRFLKLNQDEYSSLDLDDSEAFLMMKKIAQFCKKEYPTMIALDSLLVNYGSGYFNKNEPALDFANSVLKNVLSTLIVKGVDAGLISEVSGYSIEELIGE